MHLREFSFKRNLSAQFEFGKISNVRLKLYLALTLDK